MLVFVLVAASLGFQQLQSAEQCAAVDFVSGNGNGNGKGSGTGRGVARATVSGIVQTVVNCGLASSSFISDSDSDSIPSQVLVLGGNSCPLYMTFDIYG